MKIAMTAGSLVALAVLCGQALAAAGVRRRPEIVFAVSALALQTRPVAYTLHLGEVNLILAALIGADLLRPRDGAWWQGIGTGLAAGIKLTPLIFVAYLALTGRLRAAAVAAGTFAVTVAAGFGWLPGGVPDVLAGRGVLRPEPDRRPGQPVGPVAVRGGSPAGRHRGPAARLVAGRGAGGRPGGPGHRGLGAPARVPDGRVPVLRRHRPAGLADLLDAPLGLGRPAAGGADRGGLAAPLAAWALAAAAAAAVFSGYTPLPWPGHPAGPGRMVASDLYVLFGLAVLAVVGVALAREAEGLDLPEGPDPCDQLGHERGQRGPGRLDVQQRAVDQVDVVQAMVHSTLVTRREPWILVSVRYSVSNRDGWPPTRSAFRACTVSRMVPSWFAPDFEGASIAGISCGRGDSNPHGVATNRT